MRDYKGDGEERVRFSSDLGIMFDGVCIGYILRDERLEWMG